MPKLNTSTSGRPVSVRLDLTAWHKAIEREGTAAVQRLVEAVVAGVRPELERQGALAGWRAVEGHVAKLLRDARAAGHAAGRREVVLTPETLKALADLRPTVNVAPAAVVVENRVEVPQRPVRATPQRDGSVLLVPQE
jgi:hypothetical protein